MYARAHGYLERNRQIFPNDFVARSTLTRHQERSAREHSSTRGKVHEDRGGAALADAWSTVNDDNFELAKGRADAVEVVPTPGEASAWR